MTDSCRKVDPQILLLAAPKSRSTAFFPVYETSPCTPLLFPLHEPPESPCNNKQLTTCYELAERQIFRQSKFKPSSSQRRAMILQDFKLHLLFFCAQLNCPCHEYHVWLFLSKGQRVDGKCRKEESALGMTRTCLIEFIK